MEIRIYKKNDGYHLAIILEKPFDINTTDVLTFVPLSKEDADNMLFPSRFTEETNLTLEHIPATGYNMEVFIIREKFVSVGKIEKHI